MTGVPGGEATQFKPGQSGNPGGRPKRKRITEALEKVLTPEQCLAVAQALLKQAKKGSISHVQEAANRLEGKVEAADESAGGVTFNVIISAPRPHRPSARYQFSNEASSQQYSACESARNPSQFPGPYKIEPT